MGFLIKMWDAIVNIISQVGLVFYESSFFILIGLLFAGILHEFIPMTLVARHLGQKNLKSIIWAAMLGVPLPLCSCSVLPAAATLRQKGASKPATAAFIVSVPETGVDSIAVSYGLMGPFMAVYRPLVALVSALLVGLVCAFITRNEKDEIPENMGDMVTHDHTHEDDCNHDHDHANEGGDDAQTDHKARMERILRHGFSSMLDDIAFWVVAGLVVTGVMLALLPGDFFATALGWDSGIVPMLVMIAIGIPLYTCASMSTPVAAGLIASGLSPGAALVYLLVGPATSIATINIVGRMLGFRVMWAYLSSIIIVAIAAGLLLDFYAADIVRESTMIALNEPDGLFMRIIKLAAMALFLGLVVASFWRKSYQEPISDLKGQLSSFGRGIWYVRRPIGFAVLLGAIVLAVPLFTLQVSPGNRGIILRFGKVVENDLPPGLHFHLPWPISRGVAINTSEIRQISINSSSGYGTFSARNMGTDIFLTADENIVLLGSTVNYRINNAYRFRFGGEHNEDLLRDVARRILVAEVLERPIDQIFTTERAKVESRYRTRLKTAVEALERGYEIVDARLVYAHAPERVHDAFRDVASALEDLQRMVFDADGDALSAVNRAKGDAVEARARAEADAIKVVSQAKSSTAAFGPMADAHKAHPRLTERRLQLEAQERYLSVPKIYMNAVKNGGGIDLWVGQQEDDLLKFKFRD